MSDYAVSVDGWVRLKEARDVAWRAWVAADTAFAAALRAEYGAEASYNRYSPQIWTPAITAAYAPVPIAGARYRAAQLALETSEVRQ